MGNSIKTMENKVAMFFKMFFGTQKITLDEDILPEECKLALENIEEMEIQFSKEVDEENKTIKKTQQKKDTIPLSSIDEKTEIIDKNNEITIDERN